MISSNPFPLSEAQLRELADVLAKAGEPIPIMSQAAWDALCSPEQILKAFSSPPRPLLPIFSGLGEGLTLDLLRALDDLLTSEIEPYPLGNDEDLFDDEDHEDDEEIGFGPYL